MRDSIGHPHDIDQFLDGLKQSKRYRFNWRGNIATPISFARDRGYLPKDYQGLFKVDWRKRKIPRRVVVFTPTEMEKLLLAAKPAVAVCIAIQNIAQVALVAGHTVKELQTDYLHVVDQKAANAWFGIFPQLAALPKPITASNDAAGKNEAVA